MPISSEKKFGKIEYLFIIKNAQQVRNRGQWPELDKESIYMKSASNIRLSGKELNAFP